MKRTQIAKSDLKVGHKTALGEVTDIKVSPSGKTMLITVARISDGTPFTDRINAKGNIGIYDNYDA